MPAAQVMYPSFIFNPRRRYDLSRRGDLSFSMRGNPSRRGGDPSNHKPVGDRSHIAAGEHSFDVIPKQRSVKALV